MTAARFRRLQTPPFYALTPFIIGSVSFVLLRYGLAHASDVIHRIVLLGVLAHPPPTAPIAYEAATVLAPAPVGFIWQALVFVSIPVGIAGCIRASIDVFHLTIIFD